MPRNVELIQKLFGSREPLPSIELADNALKLGGIVAKLYALKSDLNGEVDILLGNIDDIIEELHTHENDDVRHLTPSQINKINAAITQAQAVVIIGQIFAEEKPSIVEAAAESAAGISKQYTDTEVAKVKSDLEKQIGDMNLPIVIDPETGEEETQPIGEALEVNPQKIINPEYFYRFKNMIDNSSFEVFDGVTLRPLGWDNGIVTEDASMFHSHSLKLTSGQVAKQTTQHQADATWMQGAYDTDDVIIAFYHKWDSVGIKVYDMVNESYLTLTALDGDLSEIGSSTEVVYPYAENWNQFRCMVKFTPLSSTRKLRVEFGCKTGGTKGMCFVDAPTMEPYVEGDYPSIYKDGRYSETAYQLQNPPPGDVDRFTPLEHFKIVNSTEDSNGNITYQELVRSDNSLAIKREADPNSKDANGYYQTIVETFYKTDGVTVNYVDTYTFTYSSAGAILTESKTTTEVW